MTKTLPNPISDLAVWNTLQEEDRKGFQETWSLQVTDPNTQRSIWILLNLLSSQNGFRRVTEAWAVVSHRKENREVSKLAVKQSQDLSSFSADENEVIRLSDCEIGPDFCRGSVQSKGRTVKWDLKLQLARETGFSFIPESFSRYRLISSRWASTQSDLRVDGFTEVDGERVEWKYAHGTRSHRAGSREWHSWIQGSCNTFKNEQGEPVDFVFEGLSGRARLFGGFLSPMLSSYFFVYQGKSYRFNTPWDLIRNRSQHNLTHWEFEAEQGELSFRGQARAEHRDFAGITYEDTDGSLLYNANSKLSQLKIVVYRRGKLEQTVYSNGLASIEVVSREKNPYVPLVI